MQKKRLDRVFSSNYTIRSSPILFSGSRKGQVTIFIILGIVALLAIILIIAIKTEIVTFKPGEIIPTEKSRVESLITSCIESIGEDAVRRLGAQGGYLSVPSSIAENANLHLRTSPLSLVPYWAYGTQTMYPTLDEIKMQLDREIEQKLHGCVFEPDRLDTYQIEERDLVKVNTELVESKIIFNVRWHLVIRDKNGEVVTEVVDHVAESDIKLKRVYDLSRRIVERELRDLKLEDLTQDLIALEHPDVPVAGFEVSCGTKRWEIDTVKQTLKDLLRYNLARLQVKGTDIVEYPEDLSYYTNHYVWDIGDDILFNDDVSVVFSFDDSYPFSFDVTPRSGRVLRSNQLGQKNALLSFFCLQSWKFTYDVSYPVMVHVRDETTGYDFKTAFTVHLARNIANRNAVPTQAVSGVFGAYGDEEFCQSGSVPLMMKTYKLVENWQTGVYWRVPLENVEMSYSCLRYQCDNIVSTQYDFAGMGDVAAARTNVPQCGGAIVRATKEGYKEDWKRVITTPDAEVEFDLIPLQKFPISNIEIVTHSFTSPTQVGPAVALDDEVTAFVSLYYDANRTKRDLFATHFHESKAVISATLDPHIQSQQNIEFLAEADFTYPLEVLLLKGEAGEVGGEIIGGYKGNWSVAWDELEEAHKIIIHTLVPTDSSTEGILELMGDLAQYSYAVPLPEVQS
ncbi:hypothetical protein HYV86_03860 [Candidatus Woesearchaeota archaeon]|nr:hypothetical protein [Candidatus Woesearchaeota archaeon]